MRSISKLLMLAAVCVAVAAGADVSGKWSGTFKATGQDGENHDSSALLLLKQTGSEITGTIGPHEGEQHAISKGTIEGDKITIESADGAVVIKLDLVLTGDRLAGDVTANGEGRTMKGKLDVTRAKE
jgi:hypothetical protein